jgi:uncharacterized protein (TIGR03437 family)
MPAAMWAGIGGVKGIDIIVKKQPTGPTRVATTDAVGTWSVALPETGVYEITIARPRGAASHLGPGQYRLDTALVRHEKKDQTKDSVAALVDAGPARMPGRMFVVPETNPDQALTLLSDPIRVVRAPAVLYGSLRPADPMLSTRALTFVVEQAGSAPLLQRVVVMGTVQQSEILNADAAGWVQAAPTTDRSAVEVRVNSQTLKPGFYQAELRVVVQAEGTTTRHLVVISLLVKPPRTGPGLIVSPSGLLFSTLTGVNPDPESATLCNQSPDTVEWTAAVPPAQSALVTLSPTRGLLLPSHCAKLQVTATTRGLAPAVHQFDIRINRTGGPPLLLATSVFIATPTCVATTVYPVVLDSPPEIVPYAGNNIRFAPVDNCGAISKQAVLAATTSGNPWPTYARSLTSHETGIPGSAQKAITKAGNSGGLFMSLPPAEPPGDATRILVTAYNPAQPEQPAWQVTLVKSVSNVRNNFTGINAELMSKPANPPPPGPAAPAAGVTLAKSFSNVHNNALAEPVEGERLEANGQQASILYSTPFQLAAILPADLPPGEHTLVYRAPGRPLVTIPLDVAPANPALFTWDGSGNGPAIIYNATQGGLVSEALPARANDILIAYADGLGPVDPPPPLGQPAPSDPLSLTVNPVEVTIAGQPAAVLFAGLSPGYLGFSQINFRVPDSLTGTSSVEEEPILLKVAGTINAQSATAWFAKSRLRSVEVIVTSNPPGLPVFVDGVRTVTPRAFQWPIDSTHMLSVPLLQNETANSRLLFSNWNGSIFTQSYALEATANQTVTAHYLQQFRLATTVAIPPTVTILPALRPSVALLPTTSDGFFNAATAVRLTPSISSVVRFSNWSGDASGATSPLTVTMTGPKSITANYVSASPGSSPGPLSLPQ